MTAFVRRGGRGTLADGTLLTWSVAEGSRGRRWRATLVRDGVLHQGLLLETDVDGRPTRLEVDTRDGLLTLHPSDDGREIHGNAVTSRAVRHLALAWSDDHELLVAGQPLVAMAACHRLRRLIAEGDAMERPAVLVDAGLGVNPARIRFAHLGPGGWEITADGRAETVALDPDGLPAGLGNAVVWPLEL